MKQSMFDGYRREIAVTKVIMRMEQRGVRINPGIQSDLAHWQSVFDQGEAYLRDVIGDDSSLGGSLMFKRLLELGKIDKDKMQYTATGRVRTARDAIIACVNDQALVDTLLNRSRLTKVIGTYLRPWAASQARYGRFYPYFNATRGENGGTRTGRLSSDLQQIPKVPRPGMPYLRKQIVAEEGHVLIVRDFSAQELRVASHYAGGDLQAAYVKDPMIDMHTHIQGLILEKTGVHLDRAHTKNISFLKLYAGGPRLMAEMLGIDIKEAYAFFDAYDQAIPGFKALAQDAERVLKRGNKIRTWGGRRYAKEPGTRDFSYKACNILVQGSSADMTKQAMIDYDAHPDRKGHLLIQVHDELVCSVSEEHYEAEMRLLRYCMEDMQASQWDVPIRSEGTYGYNYAELNDFDDKR